MKKYLKLCLVAFTLSLKGCALAPLPSSVEYLAEPPCLDAAKYARVITFLKLAGIPLQELDSYTQVPVALQVPLAVLQARVATTEYATPADAYAAILTECSRSGWFNLKSALEKDLPAAYLKLDYTLSTTPE